MSGALARGDHGLARRYVGEASRFLLIALLPVWVLGALDATPIMSFVFSDEYAAGGPALALLLGAFCLFAVLDTHLHAMIADGRNYLVMGGLFAIMGLALGLNALWIPVHAGQGAAWALLVSLGAGALAAVLWSSRRFGSLVRFVTVLRVAVAVLIAVTASLALHVSGWWLIPKLGGLLLLYGLVLVALRELGPRELAPLAFWRSS
jgi:O-antigen/teichoic acid export membrane protein